MTLIQVSSRFGGAHCTHTHARTHAHIRERERERERRTQTAMGLFDSRFQGRHDLSPQMSNLNTHTHTHTHTQIHTHTHIHTHIHTHSHIHTHTLTVLTQTSYETQNSMFHTDRHRNTMACTHVQPTDYRAWRPSLPARPKPIPANAACELYSSSIQPAGPTTAGRLAGSPRLSRSHSISSTCDPSLSQAPSKICFERFVGYQKYHLAAKNSCRPQSLRPLPPPPHSISQLPKTVLLMGLNVHSNLLHLIRDWGQWGVWVPVSYQNTTTKTIKRYDGRYDVSACCEHEGETYAGECYCKKSLSRPCTGFETTRHILFKVHSNPLRVIREGGGRGVWVPISYQNVTTKNDKTLGWSLQHQHWLFQRFVGREQSHRDSARGHNCWEQLKKEEHPTLRESSPPHPPRTHPIAPPRTHSLVSSLCHISRVRVSTIVYGQDSRSVW